MPSLGDYLIIGVVAAVVTFVVTPAVAWYAKRRGWVYIPNERSVHTSPVPDVGGLAMLIGFFAALGVARMLDQFDGLFRTNTEPLGVAIAAIIIFLVGFIDDIHDIPPPAKVTGTVLAGVALVWFGVTMYFVRVPFYDVIVLSPDWKPLVTVLWLLVMTQAINLIDGLDGLAAGIVAIGAGAFFLYSNRLAELDLLSAPNIGPLFAIITVGLCLGFLPHNFNPARIFMGDGGAFLLGLLMAVSTSVVGGRADENTQAFVGQTFFFLAPLVIPLLILGVPILDTAVRDRAAHDPPAGDRRGRQGSPAPSPDEPRPRSPAQRADPVDVDGVALGVRALPGAHQREPDLPPVRDRRPGDRAVHRLPPERPPPHQRRPLTRPREPARTVCFR